MVLCFSIREYIILFVFFVCDINSHWVSMSDLLFHLFYKGLHFLCAILTAIECHCLIYYFVCFIKGCKMVTFYHLVFIYLLKCFHKEKFFPSTKWLRLVHALLGNCSLHRKNVKELCGQCPLDLVVDSTGGNWFFSWATYVHCFQRYFKIHLPAKRLALLQYL